jgi:hypothetical protein
MPPTLAKTKSISNAALETVCSNATAAPRARTGAISTWTMPIRSSVSAIVPREYLLRSLRRPQNNQHRRPTHPLRHRLAIPLPLPPISPRCRRPPLPQITPLRPLRMHPLCPLSVRRIIPRRNRPYRQRTRRPPIPPSTRQSTRRPIRQWIPQRIRPPIPRIIRRPIPRRHPLRVRRCPL